MPDDLGQRLRQKISSMQGGSQGFASGAKPIPTGRSGTAPWLGGRNWAGFGKPQKNYFNFTPPPTPPGGVPGVESAVGFRRFSNHPVSNDYISSVLPGMEAPAPPEMTKLPGPPAGPFADARRFGRRFGDPASQAAPQPDGGTLDKLRLLNDRSQAAINSFQPPTTSNWEDDRAKAMQEGASGWDARHAVMEAARKRAMMHNGNTGPMNRNLIGSANMADSHFVPGVHERPESITGQSKFGGGAGRTTMSSLLPDGRSQFVRPDGAPVDEARANELLAKYTPGRSMNQPARPEQAIGQIVKGSGTPAPPPPPPPPGTPGRSQQDALAAYKAQRAQDPAIAAKMAQHDQYMRDKIPDRPDATQRAQAIQARAADRGMLRDIRQHGMTPAQMGAYGQAQAMQDPRYGLGMAGIQQGADAAAGEQDTQRQAAKLDFIMRAKESGMSVQDAEALYNRVVPGSGAGGQAGAATQSGGGWDKLNEQDREVLAGLSAEQGDAGMRNFMISKGLSQAEQDEILKRFHPNESTYDPKYGSLSPFNVGFDFLFPWLGFGNKAIDPEYKSPVQRAAGKVLDQPMIRGIRSIMGRGAKSIF